jgi:hypothetical protein
VLGLSDRLEVVVLRLVSVDVCRRSIAFMYV